TAHTTVAKLATSVSPISTAATLGGSTSGILPATGHRAFYEEVQRQWWQWDGAFVVSKGHPGLDPTGALCGKKQNGAAWFLGTGGRRQHRLAAPSPSAWDPRAVRFQLAS